MAKNCKVCGKKNEIIWEGDSNTQFILAKVVELKLITGKNGGKCIAFYGKKNPLGIAKKMGCPV